MSALTKWPKQNNDEVGAENVSKVARTITIKQAVKTPDKPPEGSWQTKVPTRLHYPYGYMQQSYCQGLAPSSLATMRSFTGLEALNCETKGKLN